MDDQVQAGINILDQHSKPIQGSVFPVNAIREEQSWEAIEPLITPEKVLRLYLFGVTLVSGMRDPHTQKNDEMVKTEIAEYIDYAIAEIETESGLTIMPRKFDKSVPFDPQEYKSFGYMQLPYRPIASIEEVTIKIANNERLWTLPLQWISTSNLVWGQLNILTVGIMGVVTENGNRQVIPDNAGNALLFAALFSKDSYWIPEMFRVKMTAGFPEGRMPKVLNDLIGTVVAINVLSGLAATYAKNTSQSLSVGGLTESTSGLGPQLFDARIKMLEKKKDKLMRRLKDMYNLLYFFGNV